MNKQVLILSGPTHEYIDPVRFVGNASSGKMGRALAEEAVRRGYRVEFITGPVATETLPANTDSTLRIHPVISAEEMLKTARPLFKTADIILFAAAVADYAPVEKQTEKLAKSNAELTLRLRPTPDIAQTLCAGKRADQITLGFALQTADGKANARRKLESKHLDGIVLNSPSSLGAESGTFSFLAARADAFLDWGYIGKTDCANKILDAISALEPSDR